MKSKSPRAPGIWPRLAAPRPVRRKIKKRQLFTKRTTSRMSEPEESKVRISQATRIAGRPQGAPLRVLLTLITVLLSAFLVSTAASAAADLAGLIRKLDAESYSEKAEAVEALAASGAPEAAAILQALGAGQLLKHKGDGRLLIGTLAGDKVAGDKVAVRDAVTGAAAGTLASADLEAIGINNRVRRSIETALNGMTVVSTDPVERRRSADAIFKSRDTTKLEIVDKALRAEKDPTTWKAFNDARAALILSGAGNEADKVAAVAVLAARADQDSLSMLKGTAAGGGEAAKAATQAVTRVEHQIALWSGAQNVFYGLSLGSVLLLAAIGLAITFGVMGIINMAHGEMVMLGAYTTFVVQEIIRTRAPGLFDYSLLFAVPLAFLVAGLVGIAIERSMIRFLYGRPLETLLATWGISLILQQTIRSIFGPTNREVGNPASMSGAFELGGLAITWNRMWIIVFAGLVFAALLMILKGTSFGLQTRAVTQNRRMAGSMGIRTNRIDALTFGLGSGIAGIAGVALSQIDNVSPNLGQSYIIDSFMVVVFGGVGNLWGTLVGALSLGILNKFLEPYAGAVLAKILVLVLLILFIQKRPRGLFALKGRMVEA
jgi:urea transport system permease protein